MLNSNVRNKTLSLISVFVLLAALFLGAFSSMLLVGAAEPDKVLKVVGSTSGSGYESLAQKITNPVEGTTYTFSFDYYTPGNNENILLRVYGSGYGNKATVNIKGNDRGTATVSFKYTKASAGFSASATSTYLFIGLDTGPVKTTENIVYAWNFKMTTDADPDTNIAVNPDFATDGLKGWFYGAGAINSAVTTKGNFSLVNYSDVFGSGSTTTTQATTTTTTAPSGSGSTNDEPYMIKVKDRTQNTGVQLLFTAPDRTEETEYTFKFDYVASANTNGRIQIRAYYSGMAQFLDNGNSSYKILAGDSEVTSGTMSLTVKLPAGTTYWFTAEATNVANPVGDIYWYNFSLKKTGDNTELYPQTIAACNAAGNKFDVVNHKGRYDLLPYDASALPTNPSGSTTTTTVTATTTTTTPSGGVPSNNMMVIDFSKNLFDGDRDSIESADIPYRMLSNKIYGSTDGKTITVSFKYYYDADDSAEAIHTSFDCYSTSYNQPYKAINVKRQVATYTNTVAVNQVGHTNVFNIGSTTAHWNLYNRQAKLYIWDFKATIGDDTTNVVTDAYTYAASAGTDLQRDGWMVTGGEAFPDSMKEYVYFTTTDELPTPGSSSTTTTTPGGTTSDDMIVIDLNKHTDNSAYNALEKKLYGSTGGKDIHVSFEYFYDAPAGTDGVWINYWLGSGVNGNGAGTNQLPKQLSVLGQNATYSETIPAAQTGSTNFFLIGNTTVEKWKLTNRPGKLYIWNFKVTIGDDDTNVAAGDAYTYAPAAGNEHQKTGWMPGNGKTYPDDMKQYLYFASTETRPTGTTAFTGTTTTKATKPTTSTTKYTGSMPTMPKDDPEKMALIWGKYEDPDGTVLQHGEVMQKVKLEVGKTYIFSFNYYTSPITVALGRIYNSKGSGDDSILVQDRLWSRREGTCQLVFTATEDANEVWCAIAPGASGFTYVWNMSMVEAGTETNMLTNADFSEGWKNWRVRGVTPDNADIMKLYGQEIVDFDRNIWKGKVTTTIGTMEARDPNSNFSFDNFTTVVDNVPGEGLEGPSGGNNGGNVSTGNLFGAQGIVAIVLLVVAAGAMFIVLRSVKKQKDA